jgi:ribosomal-protein-alanine N-acetyltransferase
MVLGDVDAVAEIERASFADPWSPRAFTYEVRENEGRSWVWVAEVEGRVAGYLVAWPVEDEVHLANLAVTASWRGRGIGRRLLMRLMERSRNADAAWIALEVRESNAAAKGLYESFGFRPVAIRKKYYRREGEDAVVMMSRLRPADAGEE